MSKVVILTGASRGIGREIAKTLARKGYQVIANYNKSEEKAKTLKQELELQGYTIDIFKADVSKWEECRNLVNYVLGKYNKVDVLINNAGISQIKEFTQLTNEDWNNMINTNLNSVFYMTKEVVENMIHNKNGCIINVASVWGMVGSSCEVHYSTAKAGVIGMSKALAKELGPSNIRVNCVAPGFVDTDMSKDLTKSEINAIINETPLMKIARPEEITKSIEWLIEDELMTGQVISPNAGWIIT